MLKILHVVAGVIACLLAIIFLLLSILVEPSSKLGCMLFSAFGAVFLSVGMVAFMYEYLIRREFLGTAKEILSRVIEEELVKILSLAKALEEMGGVVLEGTKPLQTSFYIKPYFPIVNLFLFLPHYLHQHQEKHRHCHPSELFPSTHCYR